LNKGTFVACSQNIDAWDVHNHGLPRVFSGGLTPELTGAGGPKGPQGTNIGHQNREAMANVGVRVERFVRLGREGRVEQVHSLCFGFECQQNSGKRPSACNDQFGWRQTIVLVHTESCSFS
jgi:hypothetical protein